MKVAEIKSNLEIIWMNFDQYKDQIYALRKAVFVDGQGLEDYLMQSPYDTQGLHLGAFHNNKLVSSLSAYIFPPQGKIFEEFELPAAKRRIVQFSRRVELPEYRGSRLAEFLASIAWKKIFETIHPEYFVVGLSDTHSRLRLYYKTFGFSSYKTVETTHGQRHVLLAKGEDVLKSAYIRVKKYVQSLTLRYEIPPPSLLRFLEEINHMDYLILGELKKENLYIDSLLFKDELPRLIAQARLLYLIQEPVFSKIKHLPSPPGTFLDIGCGPGVYLSAIAQNEHFKGYDFVGMDISKDMITYSSLSYPNIRWIQGNAYDTGFADNSVSVVHAGFLFIHLSNPELALMEIYRILKPGGALYVMDVNDSTFAGPKLIKRMVQKHKDIYEGNRDILNDLPTLAQNQHLKLVQEHSITAKNTGQENEVKVQENVTELGRMYMWAMYVFIAQREEVVEYYQKAEEHYFKNPCQISVQVQTQIYKKEE
ncbi:class I SAM-dependent methyltransferase [Microscilla marina]|uniref:Putative methyltransferase family n=1 Tax=Microscilla marina ATCC 23134 TaxID=313606 RepID=A1ZIX5_MICM2|nr:class I SAM-dependent methyltransferase [Microscilla marina]EAY29511.1 putative methyltransferase family [Microscilla marina ATCC 23134]